MACQQINVQLIEDASGLFCITPTDPARTLSLAGTENAETS